MTVYGGTGTDAPRETIRFDNTGTGFEPEVRAVAAALAAGCTLPVIGIPVKSSLDGMDALLSTVQMPSGIPVATVAIDGAVNAALLAVEMLAITDDTLAEKLNSARRAAAEKVLRADAEVARKLRERKEA